MYFRCIPVPPVSTTVCVATITMVPGGPNPESKTGLSSAKPTHLQTVQLKWPDQCLHQVKQLRSEQYLVRADAGKFWVPCNGLDIQESCITAATSTATDFAPLRLLRWSETSPPGCKLRIKCCSQCSDGI